MQTQAITLAPRLSTEFAAELDGVVAALQAALPDVEVEVLDPATAAPGFSLELGEILTVVLPMAGGYSFDAAIDAVVGTLRAALRKRRGKSDQPPRRTVKFYGPDGCVLKEVVIDSTESQEDDSQT